MSNIEVEHHPPRIEGEDELYTVSGVSGGWDQKWKVWFKRVSEHIVEVADEKYGNSHSRSECLPNAAEALVCQERPRLARDESGAIIAKLVVNDIE